MSAAPNPRPPRIPADIAFRELVGIVSAGLQFHNIRWTPEAEQDAVCSLFIQAARDGFITLWNRPEPAKTPTPINRTSDPPKFDRGATGDDLTGVLGASIEQARQRQASAKSPTVAPEPPNRRPVGSFAVMIAAFHEIESEVPPEVYHAILEWHHVTRPEDFQPDQPKEAAACYVALKTARDQYRADQQTTVEHFEQIEEGWR